MPRLRGRARQLRLHPIGQVAIVEMRHQLHLEQLALDAMDQAHRLVGRQALHRVGEGLATGGQTRIRQLERTRHLGRHRSRVAHQRGQRHPAHHQQVQQVLLAALMLRQLDGRQAPLRPRPHLGARLLQATAQRLKFAFGEGHRVHRARHRAHHATHRAGRGAAHSGCRLLRRRADAAHRPTAHAHRIGGVARHMARHLAQSAARLRARLVRALCHRTRASRQRLPGGLQRTPAQGHRRLRDRADLMLMRLHELGGAVQGIARQLDGLGAELACELGCTAQDLSGFLE